LDLARPKELPNNKALDEAPIFAVGCVDEACSVIGDLVRECKVRAVREGKTARSCVLKMSKAAKAEEMMTQRVALRWRSRIGP